MHLLIARKDLCSEPVGLMGRRTWTLSNCGCNNPSDEADNVSMMGAWWDIGRNGEAEVQLNSDWWLSAAAVHETTRRLKSRKGRRHVTLAKDVAIVRSQRKPTTKYNGLTEFQQ